jgi:hypothetical protein
VCQAEFSSVLKSYAQTFEALPRACPIWTGRKRIERIDAAMQQGYRLIFGLDRGPMLVYTLRRSS